MKKRGTLWIAFLLFLLLPMKLFAYTQEIGKATSYYIHPVTGVIEDPGNNPGIGQGMTENVLHPQALVEEVEGRYFLTVRYNLANYIKNESFAVQNRGDEDFYGVAAEVTASTAETRDYRFEIPSKDVIVRSTFYVGPMGRDVIFYYDITNFTPGNTDFVTLESAHQMTPPSPSPSEGEPSLTDQRTPMELAPSKTNEAQGSAASLPKQNFGEKIETQAVNTKMSAGDLGYKHGLLMKTSPIIQKIYGESEDEEMVEKMENKAPLGPVTQGFLYMFFGVIALFTTALTLIALGLYFYSQKLIKDNDQLREEVYEED